MKATIDSEATLAHWLKNPGPAVFQGQRLTKDSAKIAAANLDGCTFLGCEMGEDLTLAASKAKCFVIPRRTDLPFDPFSPGLYTPQELYDGYEKGGYDKYLDRRIYLSFIDPQTKTELPVDVDVTLLRRLHDASIERALAELVTEQRAARSVAFMGGHSKGRDTREFAVVAKMALEFARHDYLVLTGGGPGLMEAANLGAYCAGFADSETILATVITKLAAAPRYDHERWLEVGYSAWKGMGAPIDPIRARSVGIPTWFYGHEPPNVFATDIAKYFQNSVREEGLLAIAQGGVVFAPGDAGTVQEIFQDACQNYYRTYRKKKSPMVLFGVDYWNPPAMRRHDPADSRKDAYSLLEKLAVEKGFADYLLLTDDPATALKFIVAHPPVALA